MLAAPFDCGAIAGGRRGHYVTSVPMRSRLASFTLTIVAFTMTTGCRSRGATREWRPEDHDEESTGANGQVAPPTGSAGNDDGGRALIEAAWMSKCAVCHGRMGRGDGPSGPMNKATDLTAAAFQDKASDEDIARVIRAGRNKMPGFPEAALPSSVLSGLVRRIRALRAKP